MSSTLTQVWALVRRYLIASSRTPICTIMRVLLWPALIMFFIGFGLYQMSDKDNNKVESIDLFVATLLSAANTFHVYNFASWLVTDKSSGMKSLMYTMGLRRLPYYLGSSFCFIIWTLPLLLSAAVLSITFTLDDSSSSPVLIVVIFILSAIQLAGLTLALSSFITSNKYVIIVIIVTGCELLLHKGIMKLIEISSKSLVPYELFLASISPYESIRILFTSYRLCKNCGQIDFNEEIAAISQPTSLIILAMIFWTCVLYAFACWFDEICPWQIDMAPKHPLAWCGYKLQKRNTLDILEAPSEYFENCSSTNQDIGIRIIGLTKEFGRKRVVDNVTLDIYKGETTLLLGHNSAGKTTLMNMILGKLNPKYGRVDITMSSGVGVCPQNSILDSCLNVKQHLELFASIKSVIPANQLSKHIQATLSDVSLAEHQLKLPSELSGGMKRKLSLAMAFVGNSSVLILDEPSSGLDPDSRVIVWNAIRRYRSNRTVLLSTQHMEEADYLGERIAIMKEGKIICCGSSTFLNSIFGSGYKLRVECRSSKMKSILRFIKGYFKEAKISETDQVATPQSLESDPLQDMIVELTDDKSKDLETKLIKLLEDIESNSASLGIISHGLKSSSIEDVLLNTGKVSMGGPGHSVEVTMTSTSSHVSALARSSRIVNISFWSKQALFIRALIVKHLHTYKREWLSLIFYRIILPIVSMWLYIWTLNQIAFPDFFTGIMVAHYVYFPTIERVFKFKTIQLTSDANFIVYWISQLLVDSVSILLLAISVNIFLSESYLGTISGPSVYAMATIATIIFGASAAIFGYNLSTTIQNAKSSISYYTLILNMGTIVNILLNLAELLSIKHPNINQVISSIKYITKYVFIAFIPTDAFRSIFDGFKDECYLIDMLSQQLGLTCKQTTSLSPIALGFIALSIQVIFYSCLLYLIEKKNLGLSWSFNIYKFLGKDNPAQTRNHKIDNDVVNEFNTAASLIRNVPKDIYTLVASDLNKSYVKGQKVIDRLSFTVKKGECFGLLGVNGAGKSTTFSILAAESNPDSGSIWLNGCYAGEKIHKYRRKLGYDPQSNPEISLNPKEALYLMSRLRLIEESNIPALIGSVFDLLEMSEHSLTATNKLSGGTKRKLTLGMSLVGNSSLLILDEPTAGVDPIARRGVWRLLKSLRTQNGASIIIASHAMEECEAICDRISIMARGRLRCIGTFLHLRSKFAQGCKVKVQFSGRSFESKDSINQIASELIEHIESATGTSVELADTNVNSAEFRILDSDVKRSVLFKILRDFKLKHINMNYTINDSSLEEIFIALAREQNKNLNI